MLLHPTPNSKAALVLVLSLLSFNLTTFALPQAPQVAHFLSINAHSTSSNDVNFAPPNRSSVASSSSAPTTTTPTSSSSSATPTGPQCTVTFNGTSPAGATPSSNSTKSSSRRLFKRELYSPSTSVILVERDSDLLEFDLPRFWKRKGGSSGGGGGGGHGSSSSSSSSSSGSSGGKSGSSSGSSSSSSSSKGTSSSGSSSDSVGSRAGSGGFSTSSRNGPGAVTGIITGLGVGALAGAGAAYAFGPHNPSGYAYPYGFYGGYYGSGNPSGGNNIAKNTGNGTSLNCDGNGCCYYSTSGGMGQLGGLKGGKVTVIVMIGLVGVWLL